MITKRTQNAALIRYKIIEYVIEVCHTRDFERLHVTEICKACGISKVTFFKYFDRKEDVLQLYKTILNYEICIEVNKKGLHSVAGLESIISRFANLIRENPSIGKGIIATLLNSKPPILPTILTESDKAFFFPKDSAEKLNILPFWDLIEGFMLEGILSKAINNHTNASDLTALFLSTLYGAIITSHIKHYDQQAVYFNSVMKNWLRFL